MPYFKIKCERYAEAFVEADNIDDALDKAVDMRWQDYNQPNDLEHTAEGPFDKDGRKL